MAEARNDLLMFLKDKTGMLAADCSSTLTAGDDTTKEFAAGKFFEIESFSLNMRLDGSDKPSGADGGSGAKDTEAGTGRSFESWRAMSQVGVAKRKDGKQLYFGKAEELSVQREMDRASPDLVRLCLSPSADDPLSACIVKRGRTASGQLVGFLKMVFEYVTVRSVDWTEGDVIRETCRLSYGKLTASYLVRKPDGTRMSSTQFVWQKI